MQFIVGETVVYPHHGAAKITEVKKRVIKGDEKLYLKLHVVQGVFLSFWPWACCASGTRNIGTRPRPGLLRPED